jgi:proteasome lid subunit RPN8/RPN11
VAAVPTANLEPGETRFRVNEREHLRLRRAVRLVSPRLHVMGVYHSHPAGPPRPSPRDIAEAFYPDWIYVVIGEPTERGCRVRGFEIRDGGARPLRMRATGRTGGDGRERPGYDRGLVESGS